MSLYGRLYRSKAFQKGLQQQLRFLNVVSKGTLVQLLLNHQLCGLEVLQVWMCSYSSHYVSESTFS